MKRIGLFLLSMTFSFGLIAQNVIVGKVKLKSDEQPIAGVSVRLINKYLQQKMVHLSCRRRK